MAIKQISIPHPYQGDIEAGATARWIDHDKERQEVDTERKNGLAELNTALNQGYAVIDVHSISGRRHYLLHKSDRDVKREKYIPHPDSPHS